MILPSGEGFTSYNKDNSAKFSNEKSTLKLYGLSFFFRIRRKSNLVLESIGLCCSSTYVRRVVERTFIGKVNSRCFCSFPAVILVNQNGAPIWRLDTKLYKGA